jgi:hypothetical protein
VGCTSVAPVEIEINVLPTANVQVDPTQQSICSGDQTSVNITSNLPNIFAFSMILSILFLFLTTFHL